MNETRTEWFIIVNPRAGSGKTLSGWAEAERRLLERGVPFTSFFTRYKSHARELALQAARDGYRRLLAAGGDGTVHEMFCGILDFCLQSGIPAEEFVLGNIPIGSGNDWLRSLDVPRDIERVVGLVAEGTTRMQDLVSVTNSEGKVCCMANIGGTGFDSQVCERVNARKERGHRSKWIYLSSLIVTILKLKRLNVEVSGDGEVLYSGACYSVAFGNGRYSGGGMLQTAAAVMDDGLVDVLVVPVIPLLRIVREIHRLFDGTTPESSCLIYRQCRSLTVKPLGKAPVAPASSGPAPAPASPGPAPAPASPAACAAPASPADAPTSSAAPASSGDAPAAGTSAPASPASSATAASPAPSTLRFRPMGGNSVRPVEIDGEIEGVLPVTIAPTGLKIRVVGP